MDETELVVAIDLPCVRCGYLLRMQPLDGRCPECGTEVAATVAASPGRLGTGPLVRQSNAIQRLLWTGAGLVLVVPVLLGLMVILPALAYDIFDRMDVIVVCAAIATCLLFGMNLTGAWAFSTSACRRATVPADALRWSGVVGLCGMVCLACLLLTAIERAGAEDLVWLGWIGTIAFAGVPAYVAFAGQELGARADASGWPGLRRWSSVVGGISGGGGLIMVASLILLLSAFQLDWSTEAWFVIGTVGGVFLGFLAFMGGSVVLLVLLWVFRRRTMAHLPFAAAFDGGTALAANATLHVG
jgi:hypothetical protein